VNREDNLKYINFIKVASASLVLCGTFAAHAQVPEGSMATATASAPSAKAIRAENRRLEKAVVRSLLHTKGLSATNILVVARSGVVTLAGFVPDAAQIELAVSTTRTVDGVKDVRENLVVRPEGF
jgi:hyperosmotically inducible periplasmic protein